MSKSQFRQEPMAIVGFACRLPGGNSTPQKLWDFLERGDVASGAVPTTRFNLEGHYDGSHKPKTMRQPGGMFIDLDPADFDAGFFEVGGAEALAMDPNQRQMLEVVFEGLENAGIPLEKISNKPVGCFVGSYAADYADMQNRDPEDRPPNNALGVGRAILANRLSHFFNIKGPSITLDTACSGSLQGLDIACRYLQSGDIDAGIVATSNLYMSPEHLIDTGNIGSAHSPTALCHTFDVAADGYVKAEAVSTIIVKRLADAIRDRDPIRAVILGTSSNSNGRTAGIASPSSSAQAAAIRAAYSNAGITDLNQTTYLECHGTGTQAGDPTEVNGAGSFFAPGRPENRPLLIGSIKSNIGHSEPAAGISGLMKAVMSLEHGFIPGTPTFINPSPKIDFIGNKVKAFRVGIEWPENAPRRASINSFGYGGSNAHAIVEQPKDTVTKNHVSSYVSSDEQFSIIEDDSIRPSVLVLSANDASSLRASVDSLGDHLVNPRVKVSLPDLAYTLSERRTRLWHRAFLSTRNTDLGSSSESWVMAKKSSRDITCGFVFTGQGAQWPQMGQHLLDFFPETKGILEELDAVLQGLCSPPAWSLIQELTEQRTSEHIRKPEFSQPLVTALQICIIEVLKLWGVRPVAVVGHSSGEIAAAYTAGLLDRAGAITAAYCRGRAAVNRQTEADQDVGMLAVGLGAGPASNFLSGYIGNAWIACFNSPSSITVSGKVEALDSLCREITAAGHFARRLHVDLAYHSELMGVIGDEYEKLLLAEEKFKPIKHDEIHTDAAMFSSVSMSAMSTCTDAAYWRENMVSPVRFDGALKAMLESKNAPNFLIEIGPSGALAGPVSQVLKSLPSTISGDVTYCTAWSRGADAGKSLFDVAGRLWATGFSIDMAVVNRYNGSEAAIIDLPNYSWNHSVKYWHENASSKDWRFRKYVVHDLIGSKVLGSSWNMPMWRHRLNVANVPWLMDHRMGGDTIMPGAGFVTMGLEALYQKYCALLQPEASMVPSRNDLCYRFRNVRFNRAMVLEEGRDVMVSTTLMPVSGSKDWHQFSISSTEGDVVSEHCSGLVRIQEPVDQPATGIDALPLKFPHPPKLWYKCQREIGMEFGPAFQKLIEIEAIVGQRECRTIVSLEPAEGKYKPQSYYPIHPAALDGCLQTVVPSNACSDRTNVKHVMIPALIDDFIINRVRTQLHSGRSRATSVYSGRGRLDLEKSWLANTTVYDSETGQLVMRITGLNYVRLDVAPKPDPHTLHSVVWKPDISVLTQDQMMFLAPTHGSKKLDTVIDLIAYKTPTLKVLEVNLHDGDASCFWFNGGDASSRAAYAQYDFASVNTKSLVAVQEKFKSKESVSFHLVTKDDVAFSLPTNITYDLALVKIPSKESAARVEDWVKSLKTLLSSDSYILLLQIDDTVDVSTESSTPISVDVIGQSQSPGSGSETPETASQSSVSLTTSSMSFISPPIYDGEASKLLRFAKGHAKSKSGLENIDIGTTAHSLASLTRPVISIPRSLRTKSLVVICLSDVASRRLPPSLEASLEDSGWTITYDQYPFTKLANGAVMLVLGELTTHIMRDIDENQWESVKKLTLSGNPLLWVTKGAQHPVTEPDNAMIHGLFRVVRQEDPSVKLTTLDVQSSTSSAASWAIATVLDLIVSENASVETEYMERDGMLHVQRIMPDTAVNEYRRAEEDGIDPVMKGFHASKVQVQLRAERLGTLQNLMWCETEVDAPLSLDSGTVEVEVMTVGVNFKDVAITMGIVPDNEYNIGFECAGVVKRLGPDVTKFKVGDRVCMLKAGSYVNRIRVSVDRCHIIPATMSFEEAATIPSVYLCSLYALYHLGNLQEGQSVLIHSATGGVGIACIELARHKKAEIFVTVGTEEKRQFLESNYGIPRSHMFSSRNTKFADELMKATNGRGVNVIINSLIGELLDASWRILADGGNMVEIGKRDIVDRNTLSMEPFDRNCSFRAVDFSYTKDIRDSLIASLFEELFQLIYGGHIKPIHPITTFGFDDITAALSYIRSGRHLGKIVISNTDKDDIEVPIRPAVRGLSLRPDASYLIVGGLKGACGTLAIHMAQHGARHIIISSRSGLNDEASARVIASCSFHGCKVVDSKGDVGDIELVRQMLQSVNPPIAGIIQGAMVLRDKPFELMTLEDYQTAIHAKVQGTWNLHKASQELRQAPLDFFTMLASTSGIVGNKGQANYAAANTFLDAFASYRQSLGLRANTVDLGLIEDVGYVAEQDSTLEVRFDKRQWTPINESMLRKILTYSILQQEIAPLNATSSTETITGIGFPLPQDGSELASESRFSYLFSTRGDNKDGGRDEGDGSDPLEQAIKQLHLLSKTGTELAALNQTCVEVVVGQFVKILRLETSPEVGRPLVAYGLDSLSAVELRNWIRKKLGVELTTLDITNASSLIALADKIVSKLDTTETK